MPYEKVHESWEDLPSTSTPVNAAALDQIESGIDDATTAAEAAAVSANDARAAADAAQASADDKSPIGHTHSISGVSGLQTALDGKSATGHGHTISDVSGLQTALDGKQPAGSYATAAQGAKADTAIQSPNASVTGVARYANEAAMPTPGTVGVLCFVPRAV